MRGGLSLGSEECLHHEDYMETAEWVGERFFPWKTIR